MSRTYTLVGPDNQPYQSNQPGTLAGYRRGKVFGTLDCASGALRIKPENRVFFADLETAVRAGYRPCQRCRPLDEEEFRNLRAHVPKDLLPERTLNAFYRRDQR